MAQGDKVSLRQSPRQYMQAVVNRFNLNKWLGPGGGARQVDSGLLPRPGSLRHVPVLPAGVARAPGIRGRFLHVRHGEVCKRRRREQAGRAEGDESHGDRVMAWDARTRPPAISNKVLTLTRG